MCPKLTAQAEKEMVLSWLSSLDAHTCSGAHSCICWQVSWARAARTDKGVNALGQVVSLNMVLPEDVVEQINAHLPPTIRVLGFCRVIKGFDARRLCDKRCYEYFLPAWAFDPAVCKPSADQPEIVFPGEACMQPFYSLSLLLQLPCCADEKM